MPNIRRYSKIQQGNFKRDEPIQRKGVYEAKRPYVYTRGFVYADTPVSMVEPHRNDGLRFEVERTGIKNIPLHKLCPGTPPPTYTIDGLSTKDSEYVRVEGTHLIIDDIPAGVDIIEFDIICENLEREVFNFFIEVLPKKPENQFQLDLERISVIRGGQLQLPAPLPSGIILVTESASFQIGLGRYVRNGDPPYEFRLGDSNGFTNPNNYVSINEPLLEGSGMLSVTLNENQFNRMDYTHVIPIVISDASDDSVDANITLDFLHKFVWNMPPNIDVEYGETKAIDVSKYFSGGTGAFTYYLTDTITDRGGRPVTEEVPRGDGVILPEDNMISFDIPDERNYVALQRKIEFVDAVGRELEGRINFITTDIEWSDSIPTFEVHRYSQALIDISHYMNSGREDNKMVYSIIEDNNDVFDLIYYGNNDINNGVLRFNSLGTKGTGLDDAITVRVRATDPAYSQRHATVTIQFSVSELPDPQPAIYDGEENRIGEGLIRITGISVP